MDKDILKRATELENIISYCSKAKRFIKEAEQQGMVQSI